RTAGLARIHRAAIMPVTMAVAKTKTSVHPPASDSGARQYPTSQPVLSRRRRSRRQKSGGVSIAVESKQLQVISSQHGIAQCNGGILGPSMSSWPSEPCPHFTATLPVDKHCPIDGCEWEDR